MKVIFLDHDGVICLENNWGSRSKKQKKWGKRKMSMSLREVPVEHRFDDFDKKAVNVLNQILTESGAEIVTSSDWKKHASLEEMKEYFSMQGIVKGPIDFTDVFHFTEWTTAGLLKGQENFPWNRTDGLEQERHFEIKKWLEDHIDVESWVAVDDLHMGTHVENSSWGPFDRDWGLENFVWTPRPTEGIKQLGIKEKILKFLQ